MGNPALKIEPQGEWLSETEIGKRCKLHRATIAARLEDLGYEPDPERSSEKKKIHWFDSDLEFAIKSAKDTMSAMKIRELRASVNLKELKLAEARGELVLLVDAVDRMHAVLTAVYKEFGLYQPKRLAPRLTKAKTAPEISKILKADTDKIFARLKENDAEMVPDTKK